MTGLSEYASQTRRIAGQLDVVRSDIEKWIERNRDQPPSISEIARLEAYHTERSRLAAVLLAVEVAYMDSLIAQLRAAPQD